MHVKWAVNALKLYLKPTADAKLFKVMLMVNTHQPPSDGGARWS